MRFLQRMRMHIWRRNMKIILMVVVILVLIIVIAQARPVLPDKERLRINERGDENVEAPDIQQVPAQPDIIVMDKNIQIDNEIGNGPNEGDIRKIGDIEEKHIEINGEDKDDIDAEADAINAGPDREEGIGNEDDLDDDGDGALAEGGNAKQIDNLKKDHRDKNLKFVKEDEIGQLDGSWRKHIIKERDRLQIEDLQPDHLDAVKLEKDGHLNRDYKKEIFLGNHEEIEEGTEKEREAKLKDIFYRVDENKDSYISLPELEEWIIQKVQEHFDEADEENEKIFRALDTNVNGYIDWQEFHVQFLMAKGHEQKEAEKHAEDYETIPLEAEDKEQLIRYKFRWAEADEDPQNNQLDIDEFKSFRHPEQSRNMLTKMVQDILDNLDHNGDGHISEDEFAALPQGEVDDNWRESDRAWQEERRKEFRNVIDLNRDKNVTREELKTYVDPSNPNHASLEAKNLIALADLDSDGLLSLNEVLENMELFLGSKMVDTGRNFHDEF